MKAPRSITRIQEIRDAIRVEQARARRTGSPASSWFTSSAGRSSLPRRIMSTVRSLPFLGRAARWAYGLYRAPGRIRDLLTLIRLGDDEAKRARAEREELGASLNRDLDSRHRLLQDEIQRLRGTSTEVAEGLAGLRRSLEDHGAGVGELGDRLLAVTDRAADLGRSLGALQVEVAGMRQPLATVQAEQNEERRREKVVAAVYPRLESHFRGPRALVRERQSIYLPYVREAVPTKNGLPVLDLGCGRGEWLELLVENGFAARGLEQNQEFVRECRGRGLRVEEGEAGLLLADLQAGSVGAVTAFHLLEHLPFAAWLGLLQETVRVLAPGGVAIFETPNPANILVSSGDFFLDPTHHRPIPSLLLCYVAKSVGLARCRVLELHPRREDPQAAAGSAESLLERHLLGPQDYAVVAWKD